MPVFGLKPRATRPSPSSRRATSCSWRQKSTADLCDEAPHWSFIVDVTVENSKSAPPGTRVQQNVFQGPMVLSTMSVDPL